MISLIHGLCVATRATADTTRGGKERSCLSSVLLRPFFFLCNFTISKSKSLPAKSPASKTLPVLAPGRRSPPGMSIS